MELNQGKQLLVTALKKNNFDEYLNILSQILPPKLYRYFDHSLDKMKLLINNQIALTSPRLFNDAYDSLASFEKEVENRYYGKIEYTIQKILYSKDKKVKQLRDILLKKGILLSELKDSEKIRLMISEQEKLLGDSDTFEDTELRFCTARLKEFHGFNNPRWGDYVSDSKVCCFSTSKNNTLMWAHYGRMNSGFCVEYDTSKIIEDVQNEKYCFIPVIYSEKMYRDDPYPLSDETLSLLWNLPQFMYKKKDWEYEQEWRLIIPDCKADALYFPYIKQIFLGTNFKNYNKFTKEPEKEQTDILVRLFDFASLNNINIVRLRTNPQKYEFWEDYLL